MGSREYHGSPNYTIFGMCAWFCIRVKMKEGRSYKQRCLFSEANAGGREGRGRE